MDVLRGAMPFLMLASVIQRVEMTLVRTRLRTLMVLAAWLGITALFLPIFSVASGAGLAETPGILFLAALGANGYTLSVTSGSGDGSYGVGDIVPIAAEPAPAGKAFAEWVGDVTFVDDETASETTVVMPSMNISVTATYADVQYNLTVLGGTGSGAYTEGDVVPIEAQLMLGRIFVRWSGDTQSVENVLDPTTTVTMPAMDITVVCASRYPLLTVNSGSGDGNYSMTTVVAITADAAPAGKAFDKWSGDTGYVANVNSPATTVTMGLTDCTVTATYEDILYSLSVISGSGDGTFVYGTVTEIIADTPAVDMMFDRWTGDTSAVAGINSSTTTVTMPVANVAVTATYKAIPESHMLEVHSGSGSGAYYEGDVVQISADAAPAGMVFIRWSGDTEFVLNARNAATTVNMPDWDVELTASYANPVLQLTYPFGAGITLERGAKGAITWTAPGLGAKSVLHVELTNGSSTWVLSEKAQAGKGVLNWSIGKWKSKSGQPVYPDGASYRIRICTADETVEDFSDDAFAIGTVTALEIQGPATVNENSMVQLACLAHFNFGGPKDFTNAKLKWKSLSKAVQVKKGGLLTAREVLSEQICTITVGYGKTNYVQDSLDVTVQNR